MCVVAADPLDIALGPAIDRINAPRDHDDRVDATAGRCVTAAATGAHPMRLRREMPLAAAGFADGEL